MVGRRKVVHVILPDSSLEPIMTLHRRVSNDEYTRDRPTEEIMGSLQRPHDAKASMIGEKTMANG